MEDKYIGLLLAVSGSVAIGTSFIITKKVCFRFDFIIRILTPDSLYLVFRNLCRAWTMLLWIRRMAHTLQIIFHICGILFGGLAYRLVRLAIHPSLILGWDCMLWHGSGFRRKWVYVFYNNGILLTSWTLLSCCSCKLRRVYFRPSNINHTIRGSQRIDWVCFHNC